MYSLPPPPEKKKIRSGSRADLEVPAEEELLGEEEESCINKWPREGGRAKPGEFRANPNTTAKGSDRLSRIRAHTNTDV